MWPFKKKTKTEEIRADTGSTEVTPAIDSAELLRALIGNKTLTREEVLQIPAVKGSIRVMSEIVAELPLRLYEKKRDGKVREIKNDYRLPLLNIDTGDTLTASQFWRALITDYYVGKGGYAYLNRMGNRIESVHYVEDHFVNVIKGVDPIFKDFRLSVAGRLYEPWDFFILLRNTRDGSTGVPLQEECAAPLAAAYYSMKFEAISAQKGGTKKGFINSERQLTKEQIAELKASWKNLFEDNTDNMMILNKGLTYQDAQHNAREMQLNEQRETNMKEDAMLLGVVSSLLAGGMTTAKDEEVFVKYGLTPLLSDIESSLDRCFLLESEQGKRYWAFDTKELTRASIKERFEAYEIANRANIMQLDEIREREDLEPLGMNFIQLGLDTVLYDPKSKRIYTPNTGQTKDMKEGVMNDESGIESGRTASDGVRERSGQDEPPGDDTQRESA